MLIGSSSAPPGYGEKITSSSIFHLLKNCEFSQVAGSSLFLQARGISVYTCSQDIQLPVTPLCFCQVEELHKNILEGGCNFVKFEER